MIYETELWPFIEARWFGARRTSPPRLIVIHDMEYPERPTAAEDVAKDFARRPPTSKASAHICVDSDSIIQSVKDSFVAFAAPGANNDGIQIELAGYAGQKPGDWRDKYSTAMLAIAADAVAQYCLKYKIPVVHLTNTQLKAGARGIVGHDQVSEVYRKSDHTDPGPYFPWSRFLSYVAASYQERR